MKRFSPRFNIIFLLLLTAAGLFVRLYRLYDLLDFSQEQAWALGLTSDMLITKKLALIATPYLSRTTASGLYFYQAATYLYPIAPLVWLFNGHPYPITFAFALINLFSGLGLYFIARKFLGVKTALFTYFLFVFNYILVDYSHLIWHVPLLIPVMVILTYLTFSLRTKFTGKKVFLIGLTLGAGWGIHVSLTVLGFIFLLHFLYQALVKKRYFSPVFYVLGGFIGLSPLILFDLRHDFFNFRILAEFFLGLFTRTNRDAFFLTDYHLVHLLVPAVLLGGWLLSKVNRTSQPLTLILLAGYLFFNLPRMGLFSSTPRGMVTGWNLRGIEKASLIIASSAPDNYQVASIIDGESRGYTLRYFLQYIHQKPPLDVIKYPETDTLYLLARTDQDVLNYRLWELDVLRPYAITRVWPIQNTISLYQLTRTK